MNKEISNGLNYTHNKILPIFFVQVFKRTKHLQPCNYPIQMPRLKNNIYKITTIMSINDASIPHDRQVIGPNIVWSCILRFKPNE
jgi:hypothetical protein